jgi:hypothetical protein
MAFHGGFLRAGSGAAPLPGARGVAEAQEKTGPCSRPRLSS